MYKIEIQLTKANENISKLIATDVINNTTTKFEKVTGLVLKSYIKNALNEFSKEFEKDKEVISFDEKDFDKLNEMLDNYYSILKEVEKTMKDKKKED